MSDAVWQLQSAKQRFSEVIRGAQRGDVQFVTKHGVPVAVVLDIETYRDLRGESPDFKQHLLSGPALDGLDLDPRSVDERPVRL